MRLHGGEATFPEKIRLAWAMIRTIATYSFRQDTVPWSRKMRKCHRCPIYDPLMRQCYAKDTATGQTWGCRCYMPFKSMVSQHGWATEVGFEGVDCW